MDPPPTTGSKRRADMNLCAICQEPLEGPAQADPTLPDMLEVITVSRRQYHRWCIAGWVANHTTDPYTRQEISPEERADLLLFRPPPVPLQSIFDAIRTGNLVRVQQLLAAPEFDVNQVEENGVTALMVASLAGETDIV